MEGKHNSGKYHKNHNLRSIRKNKKCQELLSEDTLYVWRKKAAIEIQFLTKTKEEFYKLYLRNQN